MRNLLPDKWSEQLRNHSTARQILIEFDGLFFNNHTVETLTFERWWPYFVRCWRKINSALLKGGIF